MAEQQYYALMTDIGTAALANAAMQGTKVNAIQMAIGDGNGSYVTPSTNMSQLVHEVWRGNLTEVAQDPDNPANITFKAIIPSNVGGFVVREAGVYDDQGRLLAVENHADVQKVAIDSGMSLEMEVSLMLVIDNTGALQVTIDPTMITASRKYVDQQVKIVQGNVDKLAPDLSNHIDDTDIHLSKAFKENINKNIQETNNHMNNETVHIQDGEREKWNAVIAKAEQNAKDIDSLEITVNDLNGRVGQLENDVYNDVVKYKFTFGFSDLDGVTVTSGNWNKAKKRLEC